VETPPSPPRFVTDENALSAVLLQLGVQDCPLCHQTGALIGHGFLRGYAECGTEVVVRGRRVFCSNRNLKRGCGRTFSVKLATVLAGFMVRTLTLWLFVCAVLNGLRRRAAWLGVAQNALSLSTGYRLWQRINDAQSSLRTRLSREVSAPPSPSPEPLGQLMAHLAIAVGSGCATDDSDLFAAFQQRLQQGLFEP
jgi:hypothetical protein